MRKLIVQLVVDNSNMSLSDMKKTISIEPDESWQCGELYQPTKNSGKQKYRFSRWAITQEAASLDNLQDAIGKIENRIKSNISNFHLLPNGTRIALTLFVDEIDTVIGMGFSVGTLQFLANLNAEIDISMVVHTRVC